MYYKHKMCRTENDNSKGLKSIDEINCSAFNF